MSPMYDRSYEMSDVTMKKGDSLGEDECLEKWFGVRGLPIE